MDFYSNISKTKTDSSRLGILGSSAMGGGLGSVIGGVIGCLSGSYMSEQIVNSAYGY